MSCDLVVKIAVENAAYSFDKLFDYAVPENLLNRAVAGTRVLVPFGRGNKKRQGIIMALEHSQRESLKYILSVLDDEPVLSVEMLKIAEFMKEHYFCSLYDAVKTMLPAGLNYKLTTLYGAKDSGSFECDILNPEEKCIYDYLFSQRKAVKSDKILEVFGLTDAHILDNMAANGVLYKSDEAFRRVSNAVMKMAAPAANAYFDKIKLTPKQKSVLELIQATGGTSVKEICYFTGVTPAVVEALYKKGLIYYYDEEVFRIKTRHTDADAAPIVLSDEQQKACDSLYSEYADEKAHISLLYGITGSGKTSVFIKLIEKVINDDKGIIVMVPEISLTPQFVSLFSKRFGDKIAVLHSALSLGERLDEYKRIKKGLAKIVIGTRSAVFAPFEKIGLIIIDEEQEYSYKSESSPRYHAREIAKFRCGQNNALLVLSSATPSIETYYYASQNRYSLNTLTKRYGSATLPDIVVMRRDFPMCCLKILTIILNTENSQFYFLTGADTILL